LEKIKRNRRKKGNSGSGVEKSFSSRFRNSFFFEEEEL
jgi:hypothetical protein